MLEADAPSVTLLEKGETRTVARHPIFRLFTNMNPPDFGKKELAQWISDLFTEFFVDDTCTQADLKKIVSLFVEPTHNLGIDDIMRLYLELRGKMDALRTTDGKKQHFNLRSLVRALRYVRNTEAWYPLNRAIYEGFCCSA